MENMVALKLLNFEDIFYMSVEEIKDRLDSFGRENKSLRRKRLRKVVYMFLEELNEMWNAERRFMQEEREKDILN